MCAFLAVQDCGLRAQAVLVTEPRQAMCVFRFISLQRKMQATSADCVTEEVPFMYCVLLCPILAAQDCRLRAQAHSDPAQEVDLQGPQCMVGATFWLLRILSSSL
jgi:hypothetical protein